MLFSHEFLSSNIMIEMRVKRCWHISLEILPQTPEELLQEPWGLIVKSEKQGITEDQLSIQEIFDFKL